MNNNTKVLIIGAGAGGLVTGYHLSLAGADVTFYVRTNRLDEMQPPQSLYCYDDCHLKQYSGYDLVGNMEEVKQRQYDYVLVTLDGAAVFSEEGITLLESLGDVFRNTNAIVICLGVAAGIYEHYVKHTRMQEGRILTGSFSFLSHPIPLPGQPKNSVINQNELSQAKFAYRHFGGKGGLTVGNRFATTAKQFANIYNKNGLSECTLTNQTMMDVFFNSFFPLLAVCELAGWPSSDQIVRNNCFWPLGCKAANEIAALPKFGLRGKLFSKVMIIPFWRLLWLKMDKGSLPLDFNTFNQFHHGGKVVEQDTQVMRDNLADGDKNSIDMPNLKSLLNQLDELRR